MTARVVAALERGVVLTAETLAWLVLGVVATLFIQLPVRDLIVGTGLVNGRPHVVINDYGQLFHATVFLAGIPYAVTTDRHVRLDVFRARFSTRARAIVDALGYLLFALPWAALLAYYGADPVWRSLTTGETFPETGTPGYPLTRVAFALFLLMLFVASIARILIALREVFAARSAR